ncbi:pimeloyl-ACP methyl ester carboxylesterase [Methanolinea mesophila]|uniref:alpha/beta fold hydrolase n=1 Tax=Methanolinea mesophila TaxID=547055 RepID=UPI001AE89521|nr:alpha/beta fold hydrolase [Methanolinea mesophila]MBP1927776.1 pimeloyl-ACP methyl ester carboxylesterase [Methanolinea mesophila]
MAVFLLVHGAMHGGWCWRRLTEYLRKEGHEVFSPTLTGMGERSHLLTRETGLSTHVEDLGEVLKFEDLADVIVVGHSYAGLVITQLAESAHERIRRLVYLAAFLARDGQCLFDVQTKATQKFYLEWSGRMGDGWRLPPSEAFLARWGVTDPGDVAWVAPRLTDFPMKCLFDTLDLHTHASDRLPKTYIHCTQEPMASALKPFAEHARADRWGYGEIDAGHDVMVTKPGPLAALLAKCPGVDRR